VSTVVVYKSKYGSAKQYAEWIAKELGADLKNADETKVEDLLPYDTVIYGAGIYIGCIAGIALIANNFRQLKDKSVIVFTVGVTDPEEKRRTEDLLLKNFTPDMMKKVRVFHLRGALDYDKVGLVYKLMLKKEKIEEVDGVKKEEILPLLAYLASPKTKSAAPAESCTKIYDTPRLTIETRHVHLPNGKDRNYLFVQPVPAVCILPTDEEHVYLIRQYRAVINEYILEVPAGGMDHAGETPLQCAKRELAEEARFSANEFVPRGYVYSTPGFCTEKLWLFEARGLIPCEDCARDEDEIIDVVRIKKSEIFAMIARGEIVDAKTIALLTRSLAKVNTD